MGQKIHPEGFRVGYIHDWKSTWFDQRHFADALFEDMAIRDHIEGKLAHAGLSDIKITKQRGEIEVDIHTARPGIVIGKSGSEVDALRRDLHRITGKPVKVNIREIKRPELDAKLVAQSIAEQLQNRVAFRRAMKRALTSAMRSGAQGVKVQVSGRLGGAEMARTEGYSDGRVPLHTLRADIDYGFHEARTTTGRIGVKCWINKGEVMPEGYRSAADEAEDALAARPGRRRRGGDGRGPARPERQQRAPQQRAPQQQAPAPQAAPPTPPPSAEPVPAPQAAPASEQPPAPEAVEQPPVPEAVEQSPAAEGPPAAESAEPAPAQVEAPAEEPASPAPEAAPAEEQAPPPPEAAPAEEQAPPAPEAAPAEEPAPDAGDSAERREQASGGER
jgi:small subunit ribosomal protein S3